MMPVPEFTFKELMEQLERYATGLKDLPLSPVEEARLLRLKAIFDSAVTARVQPKPNFCAVFKFKLSVPLDKDGSPTVDVEDLLDSLLDDGRPQDAINENDDGVVVTNAELVGLERCD